MEVAVGVLVPMSASHVHITGRMDDVSMTAMSPVASILMQLPDTVFLAMRNVGARVADW